MNSDIKRKRKHSYPKRRLPLDARHYAAIDMLSEMGRNRPNMAIIGRRLSVDRRTLFRWRQRPDFQAELKHTIMRKVSARIGRIKQRSWIGYALSEASRGNVNPVIKLLGYSDMLNG